MDRSQSIQWHNIDRPCTGMFGSNSNKLYRLKLIEVDNFVYNCFV